MLEARGALDARGELDATGDLALDRSLGAFLGLAIGDALGAAVEGHERDSYPRLVDFTAAGAHGLRPGEWTDDTAMALCLAESLLARDGVDERDLLERFLRWYRSGENGCGGCGTGISVKTRGLLEAFERCRTLDLAAAAQNDGNGCIMRLAPIAIRFRSNAEQARRSAARQAAVTHGAAVAIAAAALLADLLFLALRSGDRSLVLGAAQACREPALDLLRCDHEMRGRSAISSAPRALDTLDAALCCLAQTGSFEDAVIEAVNLGGDADTIGAVTGQLAGALYGASAIPRRWREGLHAGGRIAALAQRLHLAGG
jgi:ADP-ribosyl-[dinitrogen reductase] hydrolase